MNKKAYQKPGMTILTVSVQHPLATSGKVYTVDNNVDLNLSDTGSNGTARSRQTDVWGG